MDDPQTTAQAPATGPSRAIADLGLERFRPYLLVLVARKSHEWRCPVVDASDIVQQTLMEAHRDAHQFNGKPAELAGWLRKILAHNLQNVLKRPRTVMQIVEELTDVSVRIGNVGPAHEPSPSQNADAHERAVRLSDALARLPEAQRQAIMLQYWEACSLAEIARHLKRTPAAVAGLLHRGLKRLRSLLTEPGEAA